jgi:hypothetical protein
MDDLTRIGQGTLDTAALALQNRQEGHKPTPLNLQYVGAVGSIFFEPNSQMRRGSTSTGEMRRAWKG